MPNRHSGLYRKTYRGYSSKCPDCRVRLVLETRKSFEAEVELPDGTWVELRVIPLPDENGSCSTFSREQMSGPGSGTLKPERPGTITLSAG
jgi:hypothetical protein